MDDLIEYLLFPMLARLLAGVLGYCFTNLQNSSKKIIYELPRLDTIIFTWIKIGIPKLYSWIVLSISYSWFSLLDTQKVCILHLSVFIHKWVKRDFIWCSCFRYPLLVLLHLANKRRHFDIQFLGNAHMQRSSSYHFSCRCILQLRNQ